MPGWLLLIALGVVLCCAAYYLPLPPPVKQGATFLGVVCLIFGCAAAIYFLLFASGLHLA